MVWGVVLCVCVVQIDAHVVENQFQSNNGQVLRYEHMRESDRERERQENKHTHPLSLSVSLSLTHTHTHDQYIYTQIH